MNFANVPQWAWIALGVAGLLLAMRNGWLERLSARPTNVTPATGAAPPTAPPSILESWQGSRTKLAALFIGVLAANEVWHFLPDQYVKALSYLGGAGGLFFLRDAVERVQNKVDQLPPKV